MFLKKTEDCVDVSTTRHLVFCFKGGRLLCWLWKSEDAEDIQIGLCPDCNCGLCFTKKSTPSLFPKDE